MKKRESFCTAGRNADWDNTVENRMEVPQKIKNGIALWSSDSTSENISREIRNTSSEEYMHPYVHCSVMYNSQAVEAPRAHQ